MFLAKRVSRSIYCILHGPEFGVLLGADEALSDSPEDSMVLEVLSGNAMEYVYLTTARWNGRLLSPKKWST